MIPLYFKRFRMEIDLERPPPAPPLPDGYAFVPWSAAALDRHAEVKYRCFRDELDSVIFPCLGDEIGCHRLMREIARRPGFLPEATWLIAGPHGDCATIQGVINDGWVGAIQNVGVIPSERGRGLGRCLVARALDGFRAMGLNRVGLEVTAENLPAVLLYRGLGFRKVKTLYRAVNP